MTAAGVLRRPRRDALNASKDVHCHLGWEPLAPNHHLYPFFFFCKASSRGCEPTDFEPPAAPLGLHTLVGVLYVVAVLSMEVPYTLAVLGTAVVHLAVP